jgi:ribosome biogenesis GTPase A
MADQSQNATQPQRRSRRALLRLGSKTGLSCHGAVSEIKGKTDLTVALAGNPNVGKSCLFNQLTGLNVITANYPGKTVTLNLVTTRHGETLIGLIDLPGTYALGAVSDDQLVARRGLLDCKPDVSSKWSTPPTCNATSTWHYSSWSSGSLSSSASTSLTMPRRPA